MTIKHDTPQAAPSGKDIAEKQVANAKLVQERDTLKDEINFLESVRGKLQTALVEEEGDELRAVRLTAEEYQTLIGFIPRLRVQRDDLEVEKATLESDLPRLRTEASDLKVESKTERDSLRRSRKNIVQEQENHKEIMVLKREEMETVYGELSKARRTLTETQQETTDELKRVEEATYKLNEYRDFIVRKARDVMRMWRQVERKWGEVFPDREPAFKDQRPITDDPDAFVEENVVESNSEVDTKEN